MNRSIVYPNGEKAFQVLSQKLAKEISYNFPYAIISITDPGETPVSFIDKLDLKGILRLEFYDVENGRDCFSNSDAEKVVDFVYDNEKNVDLFIVHCGMGVSRSSGLAAAISKTLNGEDSLFFKYYTPNMLVYRKTLNEFQKRENVCLNCERLKTENNDLRAILKEFYEAEWMVEPTWTSNSKRDALLEKVEKFT